MASEDEKKPAAAKAPRPTPRKQPETKTKEPPAQGLDFSKLDLSVERVDERISPSETNVFDK